MIHEVRDTRKIIAEFLRHCADEIERDEKHPVACFVQCYWMHGAVTRCRHAERGFNLLTGLGGLDLLKLELLGEIMGR